VGRAHLITCVPMLTLRFLRMGGAFATVVVLVACSGTDGPKYKDSTAYCKGRAEAECSSEVIKACAAPDATRCVTSRYSACVNAVPNGTTYNASGAEACVNAVRSSYADAKLSAQENRTVADTCAGVFDGPGLANAPCKQDGDCKMSAGLKCVWRSVDTGTCQVPERVQGGGTCSAPNQLCVPGYHCGATQHCDVNGQVGEGCNDALPCVESARCIAALCVKKFEDGRACSNDEECLSSLCARGVSSPMGLCVSQMTLAPNEPFCMDAR
jgi:hypothetical protein